ncbi:MAG: hypothetical protein KAJ86_06915 [Alphaproteobacteria bacterium]|nr:hypothetical protein [Alphaproteobacteria bacterium]
MKEFLKTTKLSAILVLTIVALTLGVLIPDVQAQTPADSPCDPDYYDSLESRAWLEAQREITQNQNLIFKPDSVLEYTCFDRFLNELAEHAINMFSETRHWGTILPSNSMDNALRNLVGSALSGYLSGNFSHPMLGGRLSSVIYKTDTISGGSYTCDIMDRVWQTGTVINKKGDYDSTGTAKCRDFISNPENDGFFTFEEYRDSEDKRYLPNQCEPSISNRWTQEINTALVSAHTPWQEDDVVTYLENLDPDKCSKSPTIQTGLTVYRGAGTDTYPEKICLPPGCNYDPKSKKCTPN